MSINILVADDHEMVRTGLSSLLEDSNIRIVAEAGTGDEAVTQAKKHRPDVILLDIRMPGADGLATLEKIQNEIPESRVVMLSTYDNPTYVARSVALGACDYVLKGSSRADLIAAIEAAHKGESPTSGGQMQKVATAMETRQNKHEDVPLTNREAQVLKHIALGLSNREIAKSLEISIETVKEHVQNILRKISVTDRTQAAVWAVRRNLV